MTPANRIKYLTIITALFLIMTSAVNSAANTFGSFAIGARLDKVGTAGNAGTVSIIQGSAQGLTSTGTQLWDQDTEGIGGIAGTAEAGDDFGAAVASGDFNNDGYPDLAIGAYGEAIGAISNAGAINIIYGTAQGLSSVNNHMMYQANAGIGGKVEANDQFGKSLASGDFNGDGFTDLAVGSPYEDITTGGSTFGSAGAVNIIYGSQQGLTGEGDAFLYEGSGVPGPPETDDNFGWALAAADFNNDGFMDLAIGVRGAEVNGLSSAGEVLILPGSASGLTAVGNQIWQQGINGLAGAAEWLDRFGTSLATGDFNNDTFADLAIGTPYENIGATSDAGAVNIIYGSELGLTSANDQIWWQGRNGLADDAEAVDEFGQSLAAGDFNNDGFVDLAVGVPRENEAGGDNDTGAVNIIYGSSAGLTSTDNQMWWQGHNGIAGRAEENDKFGWSLAVGDVNNDGFADLAIGVPYEDIGVITHAGAVNVIYGSSTGLSSVENQVWWQGKDGLLGEPESSDLFGGALAFLPAGKSFAWPMFLPAITGHGSSSPPPTPTPDPFSISSSSFNNNQVMPIEYTLYGANTSPQLSWANTPAGTASFMLTVIDPDGGNWLHWKVQLPADTTSLTENAGAAGGANLPAGSIQFDNHFIGLGIPDAVGTDYDGPLPPAGHGVHHYNFTITALDAGDNELGSATLTGTYEQP